MSIQQALETIGITEDEYKSVLKIREIHKKGNTAEIKHSLKEDCLVVYEVEKKKR